MCRPKWPYLLMYGSHDMRHTGFPRVDGLTMDPLVWGVTRGVLLPPRCPENLKKTIIYSPRVKWA